MNAAKGAEKVVVVGLGRCGLVADGEEIPVILAQPKRFGLLAYLVLARPRGLHQRDTLLALLWPDLPEKNARRALAQSLYFLRQALGSRMLTRRGRSLVGVTSHVTSDVERFEGCLAANDPERALALYGGDLLPGLHVSGCRQFESWLEAERSRLRSRAIDAAIFHAKNCAEEGRHDDAVQFAGWAVKHAPYDERAISNLFGILAAAGDVQGLHLAYENYEATLREDLAAEAPERVRVLFESSVETASHTPPRATVLRPESEENSRLPDAAPVSSRRSLRLVLGSLATVAITGLVLVATRPEVPAADVRRVVVLPLEIAGESPQLLELGRIAGDWIAREIARTGVAEVIAPQGASAGDEWPDRDSARFGTDAEGTVVVTGVVYNRGDTLVIEGVISEASSGRIAVKLPELADTTLDPVVMAETFGRRVAGGLATALDPRFGRWAELASQPPSVEAYRYFLDGLDAFAAEEPDSADAFFFAAAREDPDFTAPLIWAVRSRVQAHRSRDADSLAQALQARRAELAPWDRAVLDYYTAHLRGTWDEAYQAARAVVHLAPDAEWMQMLASAAHGANRLEEAKAALARFELDSEWTREWPHRWRTWTIVYHALGDFEAELAAAEPHRGDHPISVGMSELGAYAGLGRLDDFEKTLAVLLEMAPSPAVKLRWLGGAVAELRAHGHGSAAQPLADKAADLAESVVSGARATARDTLEYGRTLYLAGRWNESYSVLSSISDEADVNPGRRLTSLGLAAARSGKEAEARSIAAAILIDDPLDKGHSKQQSAQILAALGDRVAATEMLRRAFEEGFGYYPWVHTIREFEALKGYAPFDALMKPRG